MAKFKMGDKVDYAFGAVGVIVGVNEDVDPAEYWISDGGKYRQTYSENGLKLHVEPFNPKSGEVYQGYSQEAKIVTTVKAHDGTPYVVYEFHGIPNGDWYMGHSKTENFKINFPNPVVDEFKGLKADMRLVNPLSNYAARIADIYKVSNGIEVSYIYGNSDQSETEWNSNRRLIDNFFSQGYEVSNG
jgi:hypothetical protein